MNSNNEKLSNSECGKSKELVNYIEIEIPPLEECYDDEDDYSDEEFSKQSEEESDNESESPEEVSIEDEGSAQQLRGKHVPLNIPNVTNRRITTTVKKRKPTYDCKFCPEKFRSLHASKVHTTKTHGNYKCDICHKRFLKSAYLTTHMSSHSGEKGFHCTQCPEKFTHAISLWAHRVVHADTPKLHKCQKCGKEFSRLNRLHTHRLTHGETPTYNCPICQQTFYDIKERKIHKATHNNDKRFQCDLCERKFVRQRALDSHKLAHANVRPFQCPVEKCTKTYTLLYNLKRHKLTHVREKPCDECGETFLTLSDLKRHKYQHLGYNPFQCDTCHKVFTQSCDLKKHQLVHSGARPFECRVCHKKFNSSSNMWKHLKTLHPGFDGEQEKPPKVQD